MQDTSEVKTILGIVPKYVYLSHLVDLEYPAITKAIYEHEHNFITELLRQYIVVNETIIEQFETFLEKSSYLIIESDKKVLVEKIQQLKDYQSELAEKIHFTKEDKNQMKHIVASSCLSFGTLGIGAVCIGLNLTPIGWAVTIAGVSILGVIHAVRKIS